MARRRQSSSWKQYSPPVQPVNRCLVLLVIDNQPLQAAAWATLRNARKRLKKTTRDLHRHEETDEPAFRAWIATTFPTVLSAIRELVQQVDAKHRMIDDIEHESYVTGRSAGQIWRDWQQNGGRPPEPLPGMNKSGGESSPDVSNADAQAGFDEDMKGFFDDEGADTGDPFADAFREIAEDFFGFGGPRPKSERAQEDARAIYRRMVQHLHPDRGGAWTPARARAWEQTQAAWAARDADWLARLEAEWEAGADLLGPTSAISRLRAALAAIDAARRDTEKRLRLYRKDPAWRFSLRPVPAALSRQLEQQFRDDEFMLRRELTALEETLARWAKVRPRRRRTNSRAHPSDFGSPW